MMQTIRHLLVTAIAIGVPSSAYAADVPSAESRDDEVARLVDDLLSDDFSAREAARARLASLSSKPENANRLRSLIATKLDDQRLDFDGRRQMQEMLAALPSPNSSPAVTRPPLVGDEIDKLLEDLDAPQFARRDAAQESLIREAARPDGGAGVMLRCKSRLERPVESPEFRRRLLAVWQAAWSSWLTHDERTDELPDVTDAAIETALDQLLGAANGRDARAESGRREAAQRELCYLLARDEMLPRVRAAIDRRRQAAEASPPAPDAAQRLQDIYDLSRPAMVAEFWEGGEHRAVQHLIIGVPNQPANAPKPSLFDRCDDRTAHCVSGNSLSPGDWPVGVFFPHPSSMQDGAQFHLKNLPTPRRRLAYEFEVPTDLSRERQLTLDAGRRKSITHHTCLRWLEDKHLLNGRELDMLRVLDADEVSSFAADYFATVPDRRIPHDSPTAFGNGSAHGLFCYQLSQIGTAVAGPALQKAIEERRVLPPVDETPFRMDWITLLVLASHYDWQGRDAWLARHLAVREPIHIGEPEAADVGASVAAVLIQQAGHSLSEFHLERCVFPELVDLENPGFRFTSEDGRAAVDQWLRAKNAANAAKSGP